MSFTKVVARMDGYTRVGAPGILSMGVYMQSFKVPTWHVYHIRTLYIGAYVYSSFASQTFHYAMFNVYYRMSDTQH